MCGIVLILKKCLEFETFNRFDIFKVLKLLILKREVKGRQEEGREGERMEKERRRKAGREGGREK